MRAASAIDRRKKLQALWSKEDRLLIGLMSGMSMDGLDLALVRIREDEDDKRDVELVESDYRPYEPRLRERLEQARSGTMVELCKLDTTLGAFFARSVEGFIARHGLQAHEIDAIGSHGQTLVHLPPCGDQCGTTLQIGSGAVLAELTGITTVSNFRRRNMARGGQGAPIVPLLDHWLYAQPDQVVAINNLGSICNATVVMPRLVDTWASDIAPANMPIDYFARRLAKNADRFDRDGIYSAKGMVQSDILAALLAHPFLEEVPPKSAGYQTFGEDFIASVLAGFSPRDPHDLLRTAVEYSAEAIGQAYERHILPRHPGLRIAIFSGGGVHNHTLMDRLRLRLSPLDVSRVEGALCDSKEAMAMAALAHETLCGRASVLAGATGADRPTIAGDISL